MKTKKEHPIIEAKNIGPVASKDMESAGISTVETFKQLGWRESFLRLIAVHPRYMNLNALRALIGAFLDVDFRDIPEKYVSEAREFLNSIKK